MKNRRKPSFTMNRTQLKLIAVALMTLNHIAAIFLNPETFLHAFLTGIGYFTAAVMCFFLAEGFLCTTSRRDGVRNTLSEAETFAVRPLR